MRRVFRAIVIVAPLVAAFAWFAPSGAEQAEPQRDAAPGRPVAPGPPRPQARSVVEFPDLRTTERIAAYLERARAPASQARNPFRFAGRDLGRNEGDLAAARPARRAARTGAADGVNGTNPLVDTFPLALIGIAEIDGATPHRVAVVTSPAALFHAVGGETLLGRFQLGEVTATGVVVTDLVTGAQRVLTLR